MNIISPGPGSSRTGPCSSIVNTGTCTSHPQPATWQRKGWTLYCSLMPVRMNSGLSLFLSFFFSKPKVGIGDQLDVFYKPSHAPGVIHSQSDLLWLTVNCGDQNKSRHDLWMLFPVFYGTPRPLFPLASLEA